MYNVSEWKRTKVLGLILKKFENNEAISSCKNSIIEFTSATYILQEAHRKDFRFHIQCGDDKFIDIIYQQRTIKIETECKVKITQNTKEQFTPYLDHVIPTEFGVPFRGSIYFEEPIKIKNMKEMLLNMTFLDLIESNNIFSLLMGIRQHDFLAPPDYLNLNEFGKLKRFFDVLSKFPFNAKKETKDYLLNALTLYKSLVISDRVKSIGISVTNEIFARLSGQDYSYIKISYFGLELFKIHTLNRLRWIFHPGFELLCILLEYGDNINMLTYATEKNMFKRM